MSDYVVKYTCGSCKNYEYVGKDSKGYCSYYRAYYYPDDSCKHWEEGESSSSKNCFLTTACCEFKNLPDDCLELQTMRAFRDEYLKNTSIGKQLVQVYYDNAPGIVERINAKSNKKEIYDAIYARIQEILDAIKNSSPNDAIALYVKMMLYAEAISQG